MGEAEQQVPPVSTRVAGAEDRQVRRTPECGHDWMDLGAPERLRSKG